MSLKGLTFDLHAIEDYVSVFKGGLNNRNTCLGRFDFVSELDLEKARLFKGGLLHLDVLNAHGV